ncbi:hypothetical protein BYT27DRAFT_7224760 [Phlegmacium glaucopus]|nr:hypothetical protein BYT27DRAFT_7224760 [Phlegmacium glaucopus]
MTKESMKIVLEAKYKLLCLCDSFKAVFNKHAEDSFQFYFNFKMSISGQSTSHLYFIATPLLPCRPIDPKVEKFTGNGDIGLASDHMMKAIHAFAHFSAVYTQNNLLICDLQGALDMQGTMCLIDPQSHG